MKTSFFLMSLRVKAMVDKFAKSKLLFAVPMGLLLNSGVGGGGDGGIGGILGIIMCGVQALAFYGAVFGLIFFGILKIWEIFFPESAQQTRNYIKSLVMGVLVISMAFWVVTTVFSALGMKTMDNLECSS